MLLKEEEIYKISGEISCLEKLCAELISKRERLEKKLLELKQSAYIRKNNKAIAIEFLDNKGIIIQQGNKDNWKHFKPKGYKLTKKREFSVFRKAVCVWLAPYLTEELVAEEIGIGREMVSYAYKAFADELSAYPYPHEYSTIQSLVLRFNDYGRK